MPSPEDNRQLLENLFEAEGLTYLGTVSLDVRADFERFSKWLAAGFGDNLIFLHRHLDCRENPQNLLPGAKNALVFAMAYGSGDRLPQSGERPRIAQYARMRDYHRTMKSRGESVLSNLLAQTSFNGNGRVLIDSAPILERALAARTPRGFIGKNTCFIHPKYGSFLLLGEILTTLDLPLFEKTAPVEPTKRTVDGGCGTCRRCQVHCPTGALDRDYTLDSRRCLSYWTIEHRGAVPEEFWPWFSKYFFGCDICQIVCPYNRGEPSTSTLSRQKTSYEFPPLFEIATMNQMQYESWFGGTPLTRAKREGLRRNALIAMTVGADPLLDRALSAIDDELDVVLVETRKQIEKWRTNGGQA